MPNPNSCAPCADGGCFIPTLSTTDNETYRTAVLSALCGILGTFTAAGTPLTPLTETDFAFGDITNTFAPVGIIEPDGTATYLYIRNTTDADIAVSLDGSNLFEIIGAGQEREYNFGQNFRVLNVDPEIKYLGAAPTIGSVYVSGYA